MFEGYSTLAPHWIGYYQDLRENSKAGFWYLFLRKVSIVPEDGKIFALVSMK